MREACAEAEAGDEAIEAVGVEKIGGDRTGGSSPSFRSSYETEKASTIPPTLPSSLIFSFQFVLQSTIRTVTRNQSTIFQ